MGKNAAYTDTTGRYFVFGHLFDMKEQRDLTADRVEKAARIAFGELPLADAIKTVRGKGERVLAVFSDPDCPYCRRLEAELVKLDNVTLYTFPYPLEGLHAEAKDKSIAVWCAANRSQAWAELMKSGKAPASRLRSSDRAKYPARPTSGYSGDADPAVSRWPYLAGSGPRIALSSG
jgi:thiol:disulfide interchange protein DsbC